MNVKRSAKKGLIGQLFLRNNSPVSTTKKKEVTK